jgi:C4-dicarboxylate transporter DctM subunit
MAAPAFLLLLLLIGLGIPIAFSLGIAGAVMLAFATGRDILAVVPQQFISSLDSFTLLAIPMFILAGTLMGTGGVAGRLVRMAMAGVGRVRGGLGMVVVVSTIFFSGVSGSSSADTAAIGSITLPEMRKRGYPPGLAAAIVAVGGATAVLIPPVIDLVIIGVVANISIAALFAAGILPGVLNGLAAVVITYVIARRLNLPVEPRLSLRETGRALLSGIPALFLAVIILGGILGGVFTPTEAAGVAVLYALFVSMVIYRELKISDLPRAFATTGRITGIVMLIVGMASVFSWYLTYAGVPRDLGQWLASIPSPILFLLMVNIVFLFIGLVMDALPAIIVLMPILTPIAVAQGIHPVHFGILVEANIALGMISPPVGVVLYTACAIGRLPMESVVRPLLPYLATMAVVLFLITYFSVITLFLPELLGLI